MDIYVARQPIFDNDYKVVAYELLYRDNKENSFSGAISDNVATSILLTNSYFNFGINNLVGKSKAFINFDSHLIGAGIAELLDKDKVVIEILETVKPTPKLIRNLKKLKELGYTIAIDDYTSTYGYEQILDLCTIVKMDFMADSKENIREQVIKLKKLGKLLLAEKIETREEYEWAKKIGFSYYQGFYFSKPTMQKRKALSQNAMNYVRIMNELNTEEPDIKLMSKIIISDVSLAYKLLKLVNSNSRLSSEVSSINQAIAILGVKSFSKWLSLAMVQTMSRHETDEAVKYAMIRTNLLKEIGQNSNLKNFVDELSLLGTLSILDTILEMDMKDALKSIPIADELKDSLLGKKTKYSDAISLCYAYEHGKFDRAIDSARKINYNFNNLLVDYTDSVSWAEKMINDSDEFYK
ncbi:MAG: EAL domain-containing protein [Acidaminobacteraceae bacterium]